MTLKLTSFTLIQGEHLEFTSILFIVTNIPLSIMLQSLRWVEIWPYIYSYTTNWNKKQISDYRDVWPTTCASITRKSSTLQLMPIIRMGSNRYPIYPWRCNNRSWITILRSKSATSFLFISSNNFSLLMQCNDRLTSHLWRQRINCRLFD